MAINLIIDDKVTFKVEGEERDAKGVVKPFDFQLTCRRMDIDALEAKKTAEADQSYTDFMLEVTEDWAGPRGQDGTPAPYSADTFRQLLKRPGLSALCFRKYMLAVAVKEKN